MQKAGITPALVAELLAVQFPRWAGRSIEPVELDGWDNTTFRLGDDLLVRLPSADAYVPQVEKEHAWLPLLAPVLPVPIPEPVAKGAASTLFPRPWSVYRWLDGEPATSARVDDPQRLARDLGRFLDALQRADASHAPAAGEHNFFRGGPLTTYDAETRSTIDRLSEEIDVDAATSVWDAALEQRWEEEPVWLHGDVTPSNLLVADGRLVAVIDFGCSAVGDPACDLAIAWTFFDEPSRSAFQSVLHADAGTWARGRGWALWKALITRAQELQTGSDAAQRFGWRDGSAQILRDILTHDPPTGIDGHG